MLSDTLYLDNLQEFVEDEKRIVTYKWLSRKLEVPVDAAKRMLYAYVDHCQLSGESQPSVIYAVTGLLDGEQGKRQQQVCLVEKDDLESAKAQFNPVRSVHIYSVQQSAVKDSSTLYTADYDMCKNHMRSYYRWSPIKCTKPSRPRPRPSASTITTTTTTETPPPPPSHLTPHTGTDTKKRGKGNYMLPQLTGGGKQVGGKQVGGKVREEGTTEKKVKAEEGPGGRAEEVTAAETVGNKLSDHKKGGSKQKHAAKGSVASFFSKKPPQALKKGPQSSAQEASDDKKPHVQSSKAIKDPSQINAQPESRPNSSAVVKTTVARSPEREKKSKAGRRWKGLNDSDIEDGSDSNGETPVPVQKKAKSKKEKEKSNEKETAAKVKPPTQRKRRRIQDISSDEDDAETDRGTREDKPEPLPVKRRKRVKKLKSKMYTTEDGAMVTEKVWESTSEDESEPEAEPQKLTERIRGGGAKESPVNVKAEQSSPSKGTKQASLMSFFRK